MSKSPAKGQKMQALYALHWIPNLTPAARRVGAWLVWHANASTGRCDPGQARIRGETGLCRRSVQNAIKELTDCSIVTRTLRGTESSSYVVNWSGLSGLVAEYEKRAKNGEQIPEIKNRGRKKVRYPAQKNAPDVAQKNAPKHKEYNSSKKPLFRVGAISDKSEDGASYELQLRDDDRDMAESHEIGLRILNTESDHGFVAYLAREVRNGRTFRHHVAAAMVERLEAIAGDAPGYEGASVEQQAYRLLAETDFFDEENVA